ncbi:MAG: FliA/WhiG family RNA polymerase sigma factor [Syntrophaceticus sp.]
MKTSESLLWQEYKKNKNAKTREKLILYYVPLVRYTASRISPSLQGYFEFDDLVSAGVYGLITAIDRFNPDLGYKFETFALSRIKGAIFDWLRSLNWIPQSVFRKTKELENALWELEQKLGRPPEDQEVAAHLGLNLKEYERLILQTAPITLISLDDHFNSSRDSRDTYPLQDLVPDSQAVDPVASCEAMETKRILARAIEKLPERERLVITLYYYEGLTLKEIGQIIGVSESRVSQLHTKAILRLRGQLSRKKTELII